jgi:HK97 family phage major capsid protein
MPPPTATNVRGQESWSETLITALSAQAVLLASGASRVVAEGRVVHAPRILVDPEAEWVAELDELPSDAGDADTLALTPKKIGNVTTVSTDSFEDAAVDQLDAIGQGMTRGMARKVHARFFSNTAASAIAPAGIRSYTLPGITRVGASVLCEPEVLRPTRVPALDPFISEEVGAYATADGGWVLERTADRTALAAQQPERVERPA